MPISRPVDPKLAELLKKQAAIKTAIVQEKVRQQKKQERDDARLFSIVGAALVSHGAKSADFRTMLKQVLSSVVSDTATRQFLSGRGWL